MLGTRFGGAVCAQIAFPLAAKPFAAEAVVFAKNAGKPVNRSARDPHQLASAQRAMQVRRTYTFERAKLAGLREFHGVIVNWIECVDRASAFNRSLFASAHNHTKTRSFTRSFARLRNAPENASGQMLKLAI